VSGNLSWLNWITIVLCVPLLDDRWWAWLPMTAPELVPTTRRRRSTMAALGAVTVMLSVQPALNLLSARQLMNAAFNPIQLVKPTVRSAASDEAGRRSSSKEPPMQW